MDKKIILISGAPASGKDTITNILVKTYPLKFVSFTKHRSIDNATLAKDTYINISEEDFENMISQNLFIQYHKRYGRYYGLSKEQMNLYLKDNLIPIIHTGKIENLKAIEENSPEKCFKILFWINEEEMYNRLIERHKNDKTEVEKRLLAGREEFEELLKVEKMPFDLIIHNNNTDRTVQYILDYIAGKKMGGDKDEFDAYLLNWRKI
jgi:guanylate kinase